MSGRDEAGSHCSVASNYPSNAFSVSVSLLIAWYNEREPSSGLCERLLCVRTLVNLITALLFNFLIEIMLRMMDACTALDVAVLHLLNFILIFT